MSMIDISSENTSGPITRPITPNASIPPRTEIRSGIAGSSDFPFIAHVRTTLSISDTTTAPQMVRTMACQYGSFPIAAEAAGAEGGGAEAADGRWDPLAVMPRIEARQHGRRLAGLQMLTEPVGLLHEHQG